MCSNAVGNKFHVNFVCKALKIVNVSLCELGGLGPVGLA
jgi:hypothetical protein